MLIEETYNNNAVAHDINSSIELWAVVVSLLIEHNQYYYCIDCKVSAEGHRVPTDSESNSSEVFAIAKQLA